MLNAVETGWSVYSDPIFDFVEWFFLVVGDVVEQEVLVFREHEFSFGVKFLEFRS